MLSRSEARKVHGIVAEMDRAALVAQLRCCPTRFPIDFTDAWLEARPIEELRHVLAAICIQCEIIPSAAATDRAA